MFSVLVVSEGLLGLDFFTILEANFSAIFSASTSQKSLSAFLYGGHLPPVLGVSAEGPTPRACYSKGVYENKIANHKNFFYDTKDKN